MNFAVAGNTFELDIMFFDDDGEPATPESATYRIDDVLSGEEVRAETAIDDLAEEIVLTMKFNDTKMVGSDTERERRRVTVVANYGTDDEDNPKQNTQFFEFDVYRVPPTFWTSRNELNKMFGKSNIDQWADIENEQDPDDIAEKIDWAVVAGTDEAKSRLRGHAPGVIAIAPESLRTATTRLAGVMLYEARGVKDTGDDEDGKHRLKYHQDRAEMFFRRVIAGQIRLTDQDTEVTRYPRFVPDDDC